MELEIKHPGIIFGKGKFQNTEDETEKSHEAATPPGGAAPFLAAAGGGVGPSALHRHRPFAPKYLLT